MSLQDFIAESMNQSARQVFSTMLGVELGPGEAVEGGGVPEDPPEVVALIGLAGAWAGAGSISCSAAAACRMCASMLMTEADSVNADVLDAVAELTNMIIGNVKNELESQTGPLGLSIPTVVYGRNFQTKTAGRAGMDDAAVPLGRGHHYGEAVSGAARPRSAADAACHGGKGGDHAGAGGHRGGLDR